ncbi:deoxyribonuclease-2-alpha-like isoform X3 [Trematomus bernacchii]|uniref:deoxyribonuclease-2-alpha-like isoform X3 n=1 Tax=Trematomus bernacchii TaxID=40690 RepID=UPI001469A9B3|nr:deoxyribonuclease-2-alpha-like isoform X3 [Trematomus bernacchii]
MAGYRTMMGLLLTVGIVFQLSESRVTCRNDEGNEVDWYILYKLPLGHSDNGLSYLYMDESTDGWKLSKHTIDSSSGTLANTLEPLLDYYVRKTEGFGYILYNDQLEKKTVSSSYGHSKGVVMLDRATGVWLSHSTPKFPTDQSKSFWPESGNVNDLYSGLIVDDMEENLYVKGWGNKGRSVLLPSDCSTPHHHVYNVKKVKLLETVYNDTQDHSKWCVAPISGWTCIADLNRHESQKYRGGGAICIKDVAVAKAFWTTIKTWWKKYSDLVPT